MREMRSRVNVGLAAGDRDIGVFRDGIEILSRKVAKTVFQNNPEKLGIVRRTSKRSLSLLSKV